ncbi:hypothetical protein MASR2M15_12270 [Anaerolineales bacterium]
MLDNNTPNNDELYKMAVRSAKGGQRKSAKMMFRQVLEKDPKNTQSMMWLAKISGSKEEKAHWLNKVLNITPDNTTAIQALEHLDYDEKASRNRALFRLAVIAGVIALPICSIIFVMVSVGSQLSSILS